jgi:hypothetical protein
VIQITRIGDSRVGLSAGIEAEHENRAYWWNFINTTSSWVTFCFCRCAEREQQTLRRRSKDFIPVPTFAVTNSGCSSTQLSPREDDRQTASARTWQEMAVSSRLRF